eukprot:2113014-Rhodomonas_salina.1
MDVESEQHEVKTAGSIWDCSLVLAKYVAKHTETLIKGKSVLELGSGQVDLRPTIPCIHPAVLRFTCSSSRLEFLPGACCQTPGCGWTLVLSCWSSVRDAHRCGAGASIVGSKHRAQPSA